MVIIEPTEIRFNEVLIIDYKKAGITTCFFRTPERKNIRTILMGFAYDYEIDNLIQIFDNDLNGFTIFECVDSDLDIARYKLE